MNKREARRASALLARRRRGRVYFESLVLVGTMALGGMAAFDRIGTSSELAIAERSTSAAPAVSVPVQMGGGQQAALISVLDKAVALGRRAVDRSGPITSEPIGPYRDVPLKLNRPNAGQWFNDRATWAASVASGAYDQLALEQRLVSLVPGSEAEAKLYAQVVFDIKETLGDRAFDVAATEYRRSSGVGNVTQDGAILLYALEFASRAGDLRANINGLFMRLSNNSDAPIDLIDRVDGAVDIFFDGLDDAKRAELFERGPRSSSTESEQLDLQAAMMSTLGRFEENTSVGALSRLEGNDVATLFAGLRTTGLSKRAFEVLRESFEERFDRAQERRRNSTNYDRSGVAQRLVREILPLVVAGDGEAALRRFRSIDEKEVLAEGFADNVELVLEIEDAIVRAADRFDRPGLPITEKLALSPVSDDTVLKVLPDGDEVPESLFSNVRNGKLGGLPEAYANFLKTVVGAFPAPAPGLAPVDVSQLIYLAAQRAPLGRLDEVRGLGVLIAEASKDADLGRAVASDFERYAERFAAGREKNRMPDGRQTAQNDALDELASGISNTDSRNDYVIPTKLARVPNNPYFRALRDGLFRRIATGEARLDDAVAELVQAAPDTEPQARSLMRVIFDIRDDVGTERFTAVADEFGLAFQDGSPELAAVYAAEFATRGSFPSSSYSAAFTRIGNSVSEPVRNRIAALQEIFDAGISNDRRDVIFGLPTN